ncbi:hypothetical protein B0H14DRAFT_3451468 [Mycena olivaceomarginata]|nr:hypothetical protein B0H14DRAFT_3451468 [Mycena olivaceomarginata]
MVCTEEQDPPPATSSDVSLPSVAATPIPSTTPPTGTAAALASANTGFDHLFANDIALARARPSPPTPRSRSTSSGSAGPRDLPRMVLLLVGYQDEPRAVQTYRAIVDGCVLFFAFFFFSLEPEPELVGSISSKSHSYEAMPCISLLPSGPGSGVGAVLPSSRRCTVNGTNHAVDEICTAVLFKIGSRYPAKILRTSNDSRGAIAVLQRALEAPQTFVQADTLMRPCHSLYFPLPPVSLYLYPQPHLVFEFAWLQLAQRRHQEAADASHATYPFIGAGCYVSLGNPSKAHELLYPLPELLQRKKADGKDLATEMLIRKHCGFKQQRRGGDPKKLVECISIGPADELAIFWNTPQRIDDAVAEAHITELVALNGADRPAFRHFSAIKAYLKLPCLQAISDLAHVLPSLPVKRSDWRTLGSLIDSRKRVVVFLDTGADGEDAMPFILPGFQMLPAFRLPYFPPLLHPLFLPPFSTCGFLSERHPDRGRDPADTLKTNGVDSIFASANGYAPLSANRGPSFVLLDLVNIGEAVAAADRLNGL